MLPLMQIGDVVVNTDILTEYFCCDLDACKGMCCIEGDAGAPLTLEEATQIEEMLPKLCAHISPDARQVIRRQGVAYTDQEGDLVTSIVGKADCVFTCHEQGKCLCVLEKMQRQHQSNESKPISCSLYPIREVSLRNGLTGIQYHRWEICRPAIELGRQRNVLLYEFLKEALIRRFGEKWYSELTFAARQFREQYGDNSQ